MLDTLDNPENAAASRDRGGRSGPHGRIGKNPAGQSSTPRAANSRGVRVFALAISWARHHGRPHLPPPALTLQTRQGYALLKPEGGFHV